MDEQKDKTAGKLTGAGALAFDHNVAVEEEINSVLAMLRQMKADYTDQPTVATGLDGVIHKVMALRGSTESTETVQEKLDEILRIPIGEEGKTLRLDAFRKSAKSQVGGEAEYLEHVHKMVRNTVNNAVLLMMHFGEEPTLAKLVEDLKEVDLSNYRLVKRDMPVITKSPAMWKYNERKKEFLTEWLRPFEKELGKPVSQMTDQEFVKALRQVEKLREARLEEMTHLMVEADRAQFREYNRTMNPLINGRDDTFWGGEDGREEFLRLINKLITRFSFNLEDRYLIFRTKDGGFCYLVGFSDEAFDEAQITADGKFALYPHLKVFLKMRDGHYAEITMEFYNRSAKTFYSSLKTSIMPFLQAAAVMVEEDVSDTLKSAFDMWG